MIEQERNNLQLTITQALEEMKKEQGSDFSLDKVNLAELERRTGVSRKRLRTLKENGFIVKPHGNTGHKKEKTVLTGYTGVIDSFLVKGISNSSRIFDALKEQGYPGSKTRVKDYIRRHKDLMPAKRQIIRQGNRGRRYTSGPGESYQMDWGFVNIEQDVDKNYRAACFAMMCHHCGRRYVEFFPNAKQENLFIGMIHAFQYLGVPKTVLTDNMKSVVNGRDSEGHPVWNPEYADFMKAVGFSTKLCKPRHPFTKGSVERLIRFVKDSFVAGRTFGNLTDLNYEALRWCARQDNEYHQCVDCVPVREHQDRCMLSASELVLTDDLHVYLCPERKISFDGFVTYEGRRFGVPYTYTQKTCRVMRSEYDLYILSDDMQEVLAKHNVTWSRRDSYCENQFEKVQPEEFPTMPVSVSMTQTAPRDYDHSFDRFNFDREVK